MIDWLIPQTIQTVNSRINGQIRVKKFLGRTAVWVGGYEQSGPMVKNLWKKALNNLTIQRCNSVLVLGLGCGSVVEIIKNKWPGAKITGVEIDPEMIKIGKKYFGLEKAINLKIILGDITKTLRFGRRKFDMVIVDAYLGDLRVSLRDYTKYCNRGGVIVSNYLKDSRNKIKYLHLQK
jgi:spermidine synthase